MGKRIALVIMLVLFFSVSGFAGQRNTQWTIPPLIKKYNSACFTKHIPAVCLSLGYVIADEFIKSDIKFYSLWISTKNPKENPHFKQIAKDFSNYLAYQNAVARSCVYNKDIYGCLALSTLGMFYKLNKKNIHNAVENMQFTKSLSPQEREKAVEGNIQFLQKISSDFIQLGQKATNVIYYGWRALKE